MCVGEMDKIFIDIQKDRPLKKSRKKYMCDKCIV